MAETMRTRDKFQDAKTNQHQSVNEKSTSLLPTISVIDSSPSSMEITSSSSMDVNCSDESKSSLKSFKSFFNSLFRCHVNNPGITSTCNYPTSRFVIDEEKFQRLKELELKLMEFQEIKTKASHFEDLNDKLENENLLLKMELKKLQKQKETKCMTVQTDFLNENITDSLTKSNCPSNWIDQNENEVDSLKTINFKPPLSSTFLPNQNRNESQNDGQTFEKVQDKTGNSSCTLIQLNRDALNLNKIIPDKIQWRELTLDLVNENLQKIDLNDNTFFALVQIETEWRKKKSSKSQEKLTHHHHFVVNIKAQAELDGEFAKKIFLVDFFKKTSLEDYRFILNEKEMNLVISQDEILNYLPQPKLQRRGFLRFDFDFTNYLMYC